MPELTRKHLEHFAFNGHTAVPDEVAAMAKELMDGRARIAELEKTCQGWSDAHEISKANHRARVSYLSARRAELEAWKERQIAQGRRAITDPHRFRRIFDPEQPDLAIVIDTVLDERDALRGRTAELEAALAKAHAGIADASTAIGVAAEDVAQSDAVVTAGRVRLAELEAEQRAIGEIVCVTMPSQRGRGAAGVGALVNRIAELTGERDNIQETFRQSRQLSAEDHMQLSEERDIAEEKRDEARACFAELEAAAKRVPVGYITAYRNADGEWSIEFDGAPWATSEEARADLVDAVEHCLPGLTCRTLTIYDEEIWDA